MKKLLLLLALVSCASYQTVEPPIDASNKNAGKRFRTIILSDMELYRGCYAENSPPKKVTITLDFDLHANGRVTNVKVSGTKDYQFRACLADVLFGTPFPPIITDRPLQIRQKLNFQPSL